MKLAQAGRLPGRPQITMTVGIGRLKGLVLPGTYRRLLLRHILRLVGFRQVCGHWIFEPAIRPGAVIVDLGAHNGGFSIEMANKHRGRCYAVEPNKKLFHHIGGARITKFNVAITTRDGPVDFHMSSNSESSSIIRDFQNRWAETGIAMVRGVSWHTFRQQAGLNTTAIDVLKIDIEGAELDLIESLKKEDLADVKQITVEFHDWLNETLHERTLQAIRALRSMGFRGFTDVPNHTWPVELVLTNDRFISFSARQRLLLTIFNSLAYLNYA